MNILLLLALLLFLACFFVAAATYLLYWYEHESRIETFFPSRKEARKAVQRGVFSALRSQIFSFSIYPAGTILQYWRKNTPQLPSGTGTPVILVHGLFHNSTAWALFRHWFAKAGITNCAAFFYSSRKNLDAISHDLDAYLNMVLEQYPDSRPILIGHSLGGLLLRNWLAASDHAERISGLITLGTPMLGSKLSTFSATALGQELAYKGTLIQQIEAREQTKNITVPRFALYSQVDNMVLPQESVMSPPEGWSLIKTTPVSHLAMLSDKSIAAQVSDIVTTLGARQPPSHPTPFLYCIYTHLLVYRFFYYSTGLILSCYGGNIDTLCPARSTL